MSSGWKNWVMFCSSPTRCLGALRYQAVLNALAVALLTIRFGKTSGMVPSDGATNLSGSRLQLGRQVGEPRLVAPGEHRPAHVLAAGDGVEPGHRVGVVLVAGGHLLPSGRRCRAAVGVHREVRRLGALQRHRRAEHGSGQAHPADGGPEQRRRSRRPGSACGPRRRPSAGPASARGCRSCLGCDGSCRARRRRSRRRWSPAGCPAAPGPRGRTAAAPASARRD